MFCQKHLLQRFLGPALLIVIFDQITKNWAVNNTVQLTSFLSLQLSTNTGAAFGSLKAFPTLLTIVALIAVIGIPFLLKKYGKTFVLPFAFIWAGAIGNLIDRLTLGAVRDFIAFSFWPSFNVADSAITIGVVWILWVEWKKPSH